MIVTTLNSVYSITPLGDAFQIVKLKALRDSEFNAVGQRRLSSRLVLAVGQQAEFDDWHTSRVVKIEQGGILINHEGKVGVEEA